MENIQTAFTVRVTMFKNVLSNTKYYLKAQCAPRWNFAQKLFVNDHSFVFTILYASSLYISWLCQPLERS